MSTADKVAIVVFGLFVTPGVVFVAWLALDCLDLWWRR